MEHTCTHSEPTLKNLQMQTNSVHFNVDTIHAFTFKNILGWVGGDGGRGDGVTATLTCSERTILRLSKFVPHGHHNAARAEDKYQDQVGDLRLNAAVETVVQPGHEGADGQQGNPTVV